MRSISSPRFLALLLTPVLGAAACGSSGGTPAVNPDGGSSNGALTFWGDVAPILNDKCVKCHQTGGIGPFRLDNYEDAKKNAPAMVVQTQERKMPPFLVTHDGTCGQFDDSDTLTADQIAKIKDWATGARAEGTKVTLTPPQVPHLAGGTEYKTPTLVPVAAGGQLAQFDEYRCFPVPLGGDKDRFVTGYEVLPGNAAIVHHVIAYLVDPAAMTMSGKTNAEVMQALDAGKDGADANRMGWPCFGGPGDEVNQDGEPVNWAPGQGTVHFPEKMGLAVKSSDILVVQMHYNLADPQHRGESDSTTLRIAYADSVERKLVFMLRDGFLETLYDKQPAVLPPGMAEAQYTWKKDLGLGTVPYVDVVAVIPHMHQRGRKNQLQLINGDGASSCAANVDRWDFTWQKAYFYKTPPRLTGNAQVQVTCTYDTSKDTAPVLPGWGTRNEMCLDALLLALPPGI
jgi:hypothetical protein